MDSGFIGPNGSWQYRFDGEGVLTICLQFMQRKVSEAQLL
jgi:hypothetical protein